MCIDCQLTSDSCVRRRHSGAILRHFYSLLLTELTDIHGLCNAPSVYCRRRIRNVLVTVTVTVTVKGTLRRRLTYIFFLVQ